jgi:ribosomal protein S18 acetylase RimI-like enzyme
VLFQPKLFFIGTVKPSVVASAMAGYDGHRGSVFYLAVHPKFQGLGYGQKLMGHIEHVLTEIGCCKLNIVVRTTNEAMLGFYNNLTYTTDNVVSLGKRLIPDA